MSFDAGSSFPGVFVEESPGIPLEVAFPSWDKGDVLTIAWWAWAEVGFDFTSLQWGINPTVDLGAGFLNFQPFGAGAPGGQVFQGNGTTPVGLSGSISVACDTKPKARLRIYNNGGDPFNVIAGSILLRCMRTRPGAWIKGPSGVLA